MVLVSHALYLLAAYLNRILQSGDVGCGLMLMLRIDRVGTGNLRIDVRETTLTIYQATGTRT